MKERKKNTVRKKRTITYSRWRGYKLEIRKQQPVIHVTFAQYLKLIAKLIRLLLVARYRPDLIICVATGGLYGSLIARALGIRYGVWMAQGYRRPGKGLAEKRRSRTFFADSIAFIDRRSRQQKKRRPWPFRRVLLIDDLDDTGGTFHRAVRLLRDWYGYDFEVRTMALWHKVSSNFFVDFVGDVIPVEGHTGRVPWIDQPHEAVTRQLADGTKSLRDLLEFPS